jgi:glycosyltransferase involved in cell wall biosynthesis
LVIGTIGHCHERKGQRFLIEACQELLSARRARLVIVGDGPLRPELEQMTKTLGIGDRVTFTGTQTDIPGLIASFDIFALSSIAEGMPIVLLEAMVRSLPTVATTVGANPDVIRDGESGLLVQPKAIHELRQALETLVGSESLRQRIGVAARQRIVDEFSVGRMCKDYEVLYETVASRRRAVPA